MQTDILVLKFSQEYINFLKISLKTSFTLNYFENEIKFKNSFQNSIKLCKISTFNCCFSQYSDFA